ncbi:MAG: hypothetical protein DRI34_07745 [Deltaproteobacteria bacterium]|nr:MAG: hypothetical protein DRI34_07745 [Deltaproteobacteria bacterium]
MYENMAREKTMSEARLRLPGRLVKDGKFWLAELPSLDAATQGRSRREALQMAGDLVETMADRPGFRVEVILTAKNAFEIAGDARVILALLLRRLRQARGYSLQEAARLLGQSSPTSIARYERGESFPTWSKFLTLLGGMLPGQDILLDVVQSKTAHKNII